MRGRIPSNTFTRKSRANGMGNGPLNIILLSPEPVSEFGSNFHVPLCSCHLCRFSGANATMAFFEMLGLVVPVVGRALTAKMPAANSLGHGIFRGVFD